MINYYEESIIETFRSLIAPAPSSSETILGLGILTFTDFAQNYGLTVSATDQTYFSTGNGAKLWRVIFERFGDRYLITSESDAERASMIKVWILDFYSILESTRERYDVILSNYATIKSNLMKAITSTTETRFNDTPQDSGTFSDDTHTTNITEGVATTDGDTPIARLREIVEKYDNVLKDWAAEFEGLFIDGRNLNIL